MKKRTKVISGLLAGIGTLAVGGTLWLQRSIKKPSGAAEQAIRGALKQEEGWYFPSLKDDLPLVIVYPGALIDVRAYSIWAEKLADVGYPVFLVTMPLELALLAPQRAEKVLNRFSERNYVIGGHSLGGFTASGVAAQRLEADDSRLKGVFYLASYTDDDVILQNSDLASLVVTGSKDKDIKEKDVLEKKQSYPKNSRFYSINGGDHLGFASVAGHQGKALPEQQQQQQVAALLKDWLETIR